MNNIILYRAMCDVEYNQLITQGLRCKKNHTAKWFSRNLQHICDRVMEKGFCGKGPNDAMYTKLVAFILSEKDENILTHHNENEIKIDCDNLWKLKFLCDIFVKWDNHENRLKPVISPRNSELIHG